jgi:hypothetical protein
MEIRCTYRLDNIFCSRKYCRPFLTLASPVLGNLAFLQVSRSSSSVVGPTLAECSHVQLASLVVTPDPLYIPAASALHGFNGHTGSFHLPSSFLDNIFHGPLIIQTHIGLDTFSLIQRMPFFFNRPDMVGLFGGRGRADLKYFYRKTDAEGDVCRAFWCRNWRTSIRSTSMSGGRCQSQIRRSGGSLVKGDRGVEGGGLKVYPKPMFDFNERR